MKTILVIDDEKDLIKLIDLHLSKEEYLVISAKNGIEGLDIALKHKPDLILLDIMMPKRDGLEICRNLRAKGVQTPILFLTARDTVEDKIAGLDLGADDYLVKPFSFEELAARIRTLLRRAPLATGDVLTLNELRLDTRSQTVTIKDKPIDLTLREYGLLEYLLRNKGAVVTRDDILTHVWDRFFDSFSNVVDVHLKNLRKKLPTAYAKHIETVWGKGYRLV